MATQITKELIYREDLDDVLRLLAKTRGGSIFTNKTTSDIKSIGQDPKDTSKFVIVFNEETGP